MSGTIPAVASIDRLSLIQCERNVLSQIARGVPLARVLEDLLLAVEAQSANGMLASVLLVSDDGRHLQHGAAPSLPRFYNEAIDGIAIGEAVGSCGTAASRGMPVYVRDISTDPLWADFRDLAKSSRLNACWSTPIRSVEGITLGTFAAYYSDARTPGTADVELISSVAQTTALAIERHRHDKALQRSQASLASLNADLQVANERLRKQILWGNRTVTVWLALWRLLGSGLFDGTP